MIIIKYHEWLIIQPELRQVIYELCSDDFKAKRQLTKEEAVKMIQENNLQRVHRNRFGAIWR